MNKKITLIPIGAFILVVGILFSQDNKELELESISKTGNLKIDVIIPNKSSRPGCEKTDSCYVPSEIIVKPGDSVTWQNQDVAFHSITSGNYEKPTDFFDSGHLDPDETFTITFEENGVYNYFYVLHPWMKGKIYVEN